MTDIPIVCNLDALADRAAHERDGNHLMAQVLAARPVDGGYQLDLPVDALLLAATFIDGERRCCPFLHFALAVAPATDVLQLTLTGGDGVQAFLADVLPV